MAVKDHQQAFTVIELLVVIAIIVVLTSIVVANLSRYIVKSKNVAIASNIESLYKNSLDFYIKNGDTYGNGPLGNWVDSSVFRAINWKIISFNPSSLWYVCYPNNATCQNWCFCSGLLQTDETPANTTLCVDSTGYKKEITRPEFTAPCQNRCLQTNGLCVD